MSMKHGCKPKYLSDETKIYILILKPYFESLEIAF